MNSPNPHLPSLVGRNLGDEKVRRPVRPSRSLFRACDEKSGTLRSVPRSALTYAASLFALTPVLRLHPQSIRPAKRGSSGEPSACSLLASFDEESCLPFQPAMDSPIQPQRDRHSWSPHPYLTEGAQRKEIGGLRPANGCHLNRLAAENAISRLKLVLWNPDLNCAGTRPGSGSSVRGDVIIRS